MKGDAAQRVIADALPLIRTAMESVLNTTGRGVTKGCRYDSERFVTNSTTRLQLEEDSAPVVGPRRRYHERCSLRAFRDGRSKRFEGLAVNARHKLEINVQ